MLWFVLLEMTQCDDAVVGAALVEITVCRCIYWSFLRLQCSDVVVRVLLELSEWRCCGGACLRLQCGDAVEGAT
jgi:hypothetical protein